MRKKHHNTRLYLQSTGCAITIIATLLMLILPFSADVAAIAFLAIISGVAIFVSAVNFNPTRKDKTTRDGGTGSYLSQH